MSTDLHRPTAKIYTFPVGGRSAQAAPAIAPAAAPQVCASSGSYHEAAIQEEAERNRTPRGR